MLILPDAKQRDREVGPSGVWRREPPPLRVVALSHAANTTAIAARATAALLAELETYPKPGLVSPVDSGSHDDMDAGTFRRSVAAITPFFVCLAEAGAAGAPLRTLREIGLQAEAAMLAATGGVNTHRGAIFALGLLCAASGNGAEHPAGYVRDTWGEALADERPAGSHGARAMRRFGVGGARGEAAAGFPGAVLVGLPALREGRQIAIPKAFDSALQDGGELVEKTARVNAFFALLAGVEDTNLLHRGGAEGLAFAKAAAKRFLHAGGVGERDWYERARVIHRAFVARRLSPGGSADLLAVTLFLDAAERAL